MKEFCYQCDTPVEVAEHFDPRYNTATCSKGCKLAELMFRKLFSDEEINRRQHYNEVMRGNNEPD